MLPVSDTSSLPKPVRKVKFHLLRPSRSDVFMAFKRMTVTGCRSQRCGTLGSKLVASLPISAHFCLLESAGSR